MWMPEWYLPYSYSSSLATFIDLFFHRTHPKVPPQQFFLGSSLGTPSSLLRAVILGASQTSKFSFSTLSITCSFSSMDIGWVHCASMCVFKRTSLPCRMTPSLEHSETSSRFMVMQVPPSLSPTLSPNGEFLTWSPTLLSQANSDLWAWLSTASTTFWCV